MTLHEAVRGRLHEIERVVIETQEPAVRVIDKTGTLDNPADRDHCIRYMTAVALIFGRLTAADYEDEVARDPRIDALREKTSVTEYRRYTEEYHDAHKRHIGNAVQIFFRDGSASERVEVACPVGHRKRRAQGVPLLMRKFRASLQAKLAPMQWQSLSTLSTDRARLAATPVDDFMALLVS